MNVAELLSRVHEAGGDLEPNGEMLCVQAPKPLPPELVAELRARKAELLAYLRRAEDSRALPTDPPPEARTCAWCRGELDEDRGRLCRGCTHPDVSQASAGASYPRDRTTRGAPAAVGPWQPPGAVTAPRQCIRCLGGLTAGDPDGGPCGACRYFEAIAPARPQ